MTSAEMLGERLGTLGLRPIARLRVTENRCVLVSLSRHRVLSVHRYFADAPDDVLRAIARFVARGVTREARKNAERAILAYHAEVAERLGDRGAALPSRRRAERARPGDAEALARLALLFADYNQRHFAGTLTEVPIRLSGRMRTRLGHLSLDAAGRPTEITISRRHLAKHGWDEAAHTLLHEMVHLWQFASGQAVDHGPVFRAKAREAGVTAAARRWVRGGPRRKRHDAFPTHDAPRTRHDAPLTTF